MKILMVYTQFLPNIGGLEFQIYNIAKRLVAKGHSVEVCTSNIYQGSTNKLSPRDVIDGIMVERFWTVGGPLKKFYITPGIFKKLLSDDNADIIHIFSFLPYFITNSSIIISKLKRKRIVVTPTYHPYRSTTYYNLLSKINKIVYDDFVGVKLLKFADRIIALTNTEAEFYRNNGIANVYTIPVGVDLKEHTVSQEDILEFKNKYNLKDEPTILFVGRLHKTKGIEFLLKSTAHILEQFPNIKLLFVGSNPLTDPNYIKTIEDFNLQENIISTGIINASELAQAYEVSDVIVVPSSFEAFSHVVIEAWAHKKPVVATKTVALAESISSKNGVLVDYGDKKALAEEITKLLIDRNLATKMGINGYQMVMNYFIWDKIVDKIEELYLNLLEGR